MSAASSAMSFSAIACTLPPELRELARPAPPYPKRARSVRDPVGRVDQVFDGPHDEPGEREVREDEQRQCEDDHVKSDQTHERRPAIGVGFQAFRRG